MKKLFILLSLAMLVLPISFVSADTFTKTLSVGAKGNDVVKLQTFLKTMPDVYPNGSVTGYYGQLTATAVKKFQAKYGISQVGNVGPKTLAKLNELTTNNGNTSALGSTSQVSNTTSVTSSVNQNPTSTSQNQASSYTSSSNNIGNASISILDPVGGEQWQSASVHSITWVGNYILNTDTVTFQLVSQTTSVTLLTNAVGNGSEHTTSITIPSGTVVGNYQIKVTDITSNVSATSKSFMIIAVSPVSSTASIAVTSPVYGNGWVQGSTQKITWTASGIPQTDLLKIEVITSSSATTLGYAAAGDGSDMVTAPSSLGTYQIKITHTNISTLYGLSDQFKIIPSPSITFTNPVGGETWHQGTKHSISWTTVSLPSSDNLKVELTDTANNVISGVTINYSSVIIPETLNPGSYKITVTDTTQNLVWSSNSFNVVSPPYIITITAPANGEHLTANTLYTVKWTTVGIPATDSLRIDAYDAYSFVKTLGYAAASDGSATVTIPSSSSGTSVYISITDPALNIVSYRY